MRIRRLKDVGADGEERETVEIVASKVECI